MSTEIHAYPLSWPAGWKRANVRERARFNTKVSGHAYRTLERLTVAQALARVLGELKRMGVPAWNVIVSTDVPVRNDGLPRSGTREPDDPGAAVYWKDGSRRQRCMAVDRYDRVADNLAAIAATLEAMRAIERHGGAEILDRAFTGFVALPAPEQWFTVLGVGANATREEIVDAHRRLAMKHHPDRPGGSAEAMARINAAREDGLERATA